MRMKLRHKENNCPKLGSVRFEPTLLRLGSSPPASPGKPRAEVMCVIKAQSSSCRGL